MLKRQQLLMGGNDGQLYQNHVTCDRSAWPVAQKNAVVQLNELRPGLRYEIVSQTGPLHAPVFSVAVEVNGCHFEGRGPTKRQAKMKVAELALQSFIQFPNASQAHATVEKYTSTTMDFTADKLDPPNAFLTGFESSMLGNNNLLHCDTTENKIRTNIYSPNQTTQFTLDLVFSTNPRRPPVSSSLKHLSPVVLLNKLRPGLRYMCQVEKVHGRPIRNFIMVVRLEGRVFEGCGHSKSRAKVQAAAAVLQSLYNINLVPERNLMGLQENRTKLQLPQFFAESIYRLVKEKYSQLTDSCSSTSHLHLRVLAGIVMTRGFDLRSARVVSLATGTKSLNVDHLGELGCSLSDCHAEVLSRRALLRFFYTQLELLLCNPAEGEEPLVFVPNKGCGGGFRLQDGVRFHMYVSSSPCGDARLNCPYETTAAYPSRRFCSHLRVKVNGGEGTLPVRTQRANQNWDGVSQGRPIISMSCTDKMAKWSVVGLQGALLSHLVEPIYLSSLTVGTPSHTGHLGRVMARRLAPMKHLPLSYRRQQLLLGCLSSREVQPTGRASNISLNWNSGDGGLEEVNTSTGRRRDSGTLSRLCRRSLFTCWLRLQEKLNGPVLSPDGTTAMYSSSKMAAGRYQRAVQQFSSSLQAGGLGTWIRKSPKLSHLSVSV